MENVAVVGVGLIGASFGLALRRAGFAGRILGVSSPKSIRAGLAAGAISEEATLQQAAEIADLIYLAQPVDRILEILATLGPLVHPECLVTDAGSTKGAITQRAVECLPPGVFLGGHPMAGKEQRGAESADELLFRDRPYVLTSVSEVTEKMRDFQDWLVRIGCRVVFMSPTEHDNVVALTSHLPQLLSTALSVTLAEQANARLLEVFGPGLLDMTRLAVSSSDLWKSILQTNREAVLQSVRAYMATLTAICSRLEPGGSVEDVFASGHNFADALRKVAH